jgi:hypothetical protein
MSPKQIVSVNYVGPVVAGCVVSANLRTHSSTCHLEACGEILKSCVAPYILLCKGEAERYLRSLFEASEASAASKTRLNWGNCLSIILCSTLGSSIDYEHFRSVLRSSGQSYLSPKDITFHRVRRRAPLLLTALTQMTRGCGLTDNSF